jgi:uncharacterized membrane protein
MSGMTRQLYIAIGALFLLAFLTPVLIKFLVAVVPLVVVIGGVVIVVRFVWFYTDRY